jgi:endoglucanase
MLRSNTKALAFALAASIAAHAGVVSDHGRLRVHGNQIVDSLGRPVQLAGMSLYWPQWANSGKNFYTAAAIQTLANDWKASVVRAPMPVYTPNSTPAVQYNGAVYIPMIKTVIDAAIANDIYVIVDWHVEGDTVMKDSAKVFFDEIAKSYPGCPNILWEVWNEPINSTWATIRNYTTEILPVIRAYSPNIVIVGSTAWSKRPQYGISAPVPNDSAIAYSGHFYACNDTTEFQNAVITAAAKVPVFLSEWGTTSSDGRTGFCTTWADSWLALAKRLGLSWTNWSFSNIGGGTAALSSSSLTSFTTDGNYVKGKIQEVYADLQNTLSVRSPIGTESPRTSLSARYDREVLSLDLPAGTQSVVVRDPSGRTLARRQATGGSISMPLEAKGLVLVQAYGDRGTSSIGVVIAR